MTAIYFTEALPVWAAGREREMNCELAFRALLPQGRARLRLAAATLFRVWVNGTLFAAGPARCAHGFYNVDDLDLTGSLSRHTNVVVIEVVGFNVNSYDTLDQPSFLTAEIVSGDRILAATGGMGFEASVLGQRVQRVQRYSFQRGFPECYRLHAELRSFYTDPTRSVPPVELAVQEKKEYLRRSVRCPQYERLEAERLLSEGTVLFRANPEMPIRDRSYLNIGPDFKGFAPHELAIHLSDDAQRMVFHSRALPLGSSLPFALADSRFLLLKFPYNATGFLQIEVECSEPVTLHVFFDELLTEGDVRLQRLNAWNCFRYELDAGRHTITTFAAYTMQVVKLASQGACRILAVRMIEYKHPPVRRCIQLPEHETALRQIARAAMETYLANAVDVFTDCPSRERAGWLCDSFFTARVEQVLTGRNVLERAFLENFLLPQAFAHLPEGMLPMCYPADHNDGNFIPNWAMWFVLELEEYAQRTGDKELIRRAKGRVYALIRYFRAFENEYGLLEKLKGWVFLEWSRANDPDVVQDVNFPTNMLYARMLEAAGLLYGDEALRGQAEKIRTVIRKRSYNGAFFTDNECRTESGLQNPGNMTEVCQYYAFFTGTATREQYPELWWRLVEAFGPQRAETGAFPEVAPANVFIGYYLRIELLYRAGMKEEVLRNIRSYFLPMAESTGTLWEHNSPTASCCHGFASHVLYWLAGIFGITDADGAR